MNESPNASASGSASSDDFVDFYQLLGAAPDATTTHLRRRINELYSEAQSNRDHRNVNKRRQYEALCELLPYCRIVLLDPDKRARYDRYMAQVQSGTPGLPSFESTMEEIAGRVGDVSGDAGQEKVGLLGIENDDDYLPQSSATEGMATPRTTVAPSRAAEPDVVTVAGASGTQKRLSKSAMSSLTGSVLSVIVFAAVAVLVWLATKPHNWERAILFAAIAGLLTWIITHVRKGPGGRIRY